MRLLSRLLASFAVALLWAACGPTLMERPLEGTWLVEPVSGSEFAPFRLDVQASQFEHHGLAFNDATPVSEGPSADGDSPFAIVGVAVLHGGAVTPRVCFSRRIPAADGRAERLDVESHIILRTEQDTFVLGGDHETTERVRMTRLTTAP